MFKEKRGVSALVATVLLILITVAGVAIIWGAVMPMITKITQSGQACINARLIIDTASGYTCYSETKNQASIMVSRGPEDFQLTGIQLGLSSAGQTESIIIRDGSQAVASLGFDEGSGSTTYDSSDNGNDGTINGAVWKSGTDCISGSCLSFDGVNDGVVVPDSSLFDFAGKNITISAWFKAANVQGTYAAIMWHFTGGTPGAGWQFLLNANRVQIENRAPIDKLSITSNAAYNDNIWHQAVVTMDGSTAKLYVDGVYLKNDTYSNLIDYNENLGIGADFTGANSFNGTIDEVRIYNHALSAEEIKAQYQADSKGSKIMYSSLPAANSANTYRINAKYISEVQVAPIVKFGNSEKICDISSKITNVPKCDF